MCFQFKWLQNAIQRGGFKPKTDLGTFTTKAPRHQGAKQSPMLTISLWLIIASSLESFMGKISLALCFSREATREISQPQGGW
jgi:hypothetical protein